MIARGVEAFAWCAIGFAGALVVNVLFQLAIAIVTGVPA